MNRLVYISFAATATAMLGGCETMDTGHGYAGDYGYYDSGYYRQYGRYDYNNPDPAYNGYYADRYYRENPRYREHVLSSDERIYRGHDGRYYCRRSDGTTGLIVGGIAGGVLGNVLTEGDSKPLGTVLGAIAGGAVGAAVDSNNGRVTCR